MKARIFVTLKDGVLDPQGQAIKGALGGLGFDGVGTIRQGKIFDVEISETDLSQGQTKLTRMCEKLLANTVIEDYRIEIND